MEKLEITYRYASTWEFVKSLLLRVGILCLIGYLIYHYDENPVFITTACTFCAWLFIATGNDEILINKLVLRQVDTSIISCFRKSETVYELKNIKRAYLPENEKLDFTSIIAILLLLFIAQGKRRNSSSNYPIFLELNNEEIVRINTTLEERKRKALVEKINSLV